LTDIKTRRELGRFRPRLLFRLGGPAPAPERRKESNLRSGHHLEFRVRAYLPQLVRGPQLTMTEVLPFRGQSDFLRNYGAVMVPTDPPDGSVLDAMVSRPIRGQEGFVIGGSALPPTLQRSLSVPTSRRIRTFVSDASRCVPPGACVNERSTHA